MLNLQLQNYNYNMKIIYGVAGQGFGHAMRSKKIIEYLQSKGHQVKVVTYGQGLIALDKIFDCFPIVGLQLHYSNNKLNYFLTVWKNFTRLRGLFRTLKDLRILFKDFQPNVVFSDYEPGTAYFAHFFHKRLISIGNHHFITNCEIEFPKKYWKDYLAVSGYTKAVAPFAEKYLVTSIAKVPVKDEKTKLFPPILQDDVLSVVSHNQDYYLVYLTNPFNKLLRELQKSKHQFVVYGFNQDKKSRNLQLRKFSRENFVKDLAGCRAVIGNAGFTLISEALFLGKPYYALPIKSQFEQIINAIYIEKLGYGEFHDQVTVNLLCNFEKRIEEFQENLNKYSRTDNHLIFTEIDKILD